MSKFNCIFLKQTYFFFFFNNHRRQLEKGVCKILQTQKKRKKIK